MPNSRRTSIEYALTQQEMPEGWRRPSVGTVMNAKRSRLLGLVATHDFALHTVSESIPQEAIQSQSTRELVDDLKRAADGEIRAGRSLVGLAAPQIGVARRVFLVNLSKHPENAPSDLTLMINPELTITSGLRKNRSPEACLSCGPLAGVVDRPNVDVRWTDLSGTMHEDSFQGHKAIRIGHENGHLDGVLFPDLVLEQGREIAWVDEERMAEGEYVSSVRSGRQWRPNCSIEQWKAMKNPDSNPGLTFRLDAFVIPNS